jgi:hypothetical protein
MTTLLTEADDRPAETAADTKAFLARCQARREAKHGKPGAATIARKYIQVDTIIVEKNMHGIGWQGYFCESSFHATTFRNRLTLVEFARQHFQAGILRKIGDGRYAVLVRKPVAPSSWGDVFDRPRVA